MQLKRFVRPASMMLCLLLAVACLSLFVRQGKAFSAYSFVFNWKAALALPATPQAIGYLTDFNGIGLTAPLAKDLTVYIPFNKTPAYSPLTISAGKGNVVAVLEKISWGGGVGDPFLVSCWMSQENAAQLRTLQQMTLRTMSITSLGFWAGNYDTSAKTWFEQLYPKSPVRFTGQLNAPSASDIRLNVAAQPVQVGANLSVSMYNVSFEVVPAANQTATFNVASSAAKSVVLPWGPAGSVSTTAAAQ